jgi:DNA repair exonuclease SbcCD ATPase subunit
MEDQNTPAMKGDIAALDRKIDHLDQKLERKIEQLDQKIDRKIEQLRSEVNHGYNELTETIRDSETKLLQAFYGYAASNDKRLTQNEANVAVFLSRISTLESRVMEIEKRLNFPPAA